MEVFLRNSTTRLLGHYNPGTEALYAELTGVQPGLWFELGNLSPDDPASAHRLIDNVVLLKDAQRILDAAVAGKRGRKPLAEIEDDTLKLWSGQYDEAIAALEKESSNRTWKQLKRVVEKDAKKAFVKRAFPNIPDDAAARLADSTRISEVALRYTAWQCSQIEIGVGARRTLENLRQHSDRLNGVMRGRKK